MARTTDLYRGKVFDYDAGWAEITSCYDTSFLGVELHRSGCGVLSAQGCRSLASFLTRAADWLDATRCRNGFPVGTVVYVISDGAGHFKVGKAVDVATRIKQLQTGNGRKLSLYAFLPCPDEHVAYKVETFAQRWLEKWKATGEWFLCDAFEVLLALSDAAEEHRLGYEPVQMREEATNG